MATVGFWMAVGAAVLFLALFITEKRRFYRGIWAIYGVATTEAMDAVGGVLHSLLAAWTLIVLALMINSFIFHLSHPDAADNRTDKAWSFFLLCFALAYFYVSATLTTTTPTAAFALVLFIILHAEFIFINRLISWRRKNANTLQ